MDHKILFGVSTVAVIGWATALVMRDPNVVMVALLIGIYTALMGTIVAVQSRDWRWAVAIFLLGLPAAVAYAICRVRGPRVAAPAVSVLQG